MKWATVRMSAAHPAVALSRIATAFSASHHCRSRSSVTGLNWPFAIGLSRTDPLRAFKRKAGFWARPCFGSAIGLGAIVPTASGAHLQGLFVNALLLQLPLDGETVHLLLQLLLSDLALQANVVVIVVSEGGRCEGEGNGDKQGFHIVGFSVSGMIARICPRLRKGISWRSDVAFGQHEDGEQEG